MDAVGDIDGLGSRVLMEIATDVRPAQQVNAVAIRWEPRSSNVKQLSASILQRSMKDTHEGARTVRRHKPHHVLVPRQLCRALELASLGRSVELWPEGGVHHTTADQDAGVLAGWNRNGYDAAPASCR
jgi:hypothetical protein